jgi:hypothetical protein
MAIEPNAEILRSQPQRLRALLEQGLAVSNPAAEDLRTVWEQQMNCSMSWDLGCLDPASISRVRMTATEEALLLKSLRDLLMHPRPPVELVRLAKDYAKTCLEHPRSALPKEMAAVIYYLCIGAALCGCRTRISALSDEEALSGFRWALAQPWLDEASKDLLAKAVRCVSSSPAPESI